MSEVASVHTRSAIDALLSVHALANMYRSSEDPEYCRTALGWFTQIEHLVQAAKADLERHAAPWPATPPDRRKP